MVISNTQKKVHYILFPSFLVRDHLKVSMFLLGQREAWSSRSRHTSALWWSVSWSQHETRASLAPSVQNDQDTLSDFLSMFDSETCDLVDLVWDPWDLRALVCRPPLSRGIWHRHRRWLTYDATFEFYLKVSLQAKQEEHWNDIDIYIEPYYFIWTQNAKLDSLDISIWCRRVCNTGIDKCHLWPVCLLGWVSKKNN